MSSPRKIKALLKIEQSILHVIDMKDGTFENQWVLPNGNLHRDHGPAVESTDGTEEYWLFGFHFPKAEWEQILNDPKAYKRLSNPKLIVKPDNLVKK